MVKKVKFGGKIKGKRFVYSGLILPLNSFISMSLSELQSQFNDIVLPQIQSTLDAIQPVYEEWAKATQIFLNTPIEASQGLSYLPSTIGSCIGVMCAVFAFSIFWTLISGSPQKTKAGRRVRSKSKITHVRSKNNKQTKKVSRVEITTELPKPIVEEQPFPTTIIAIEPVIDDKTESNNDMSETETETDFDVFSDSEESENLDEQDVEETSSIMIERTESEAPVENEESSTDAVVEEIKTQDWNYEQKPLFPVAIFDGKGKQANPITRKVLKQPNTPIQQSSGKKRIAIPSSPKPQLPILLDLDKENQPQSISVM